MFGLDDKTWKHIYCLPFQVTKNTKLQWLHIRIIHRILTTNSFLFKVNLVSSPLCTFCNSERETLIHTIWDCREVQQLVQSLENLLDSLFIPFHFNKQSFIVGLQTHNPINRIDNDIILLIKIYIYNTRCYHKALNVNALVNTPKDSYNIQKQIANSKGGLVKERFIAEWTKWKETLNRFLKLRIQYRVYLYFLNQLVTY